jgi:N-methylhydantoinase A/oxoprolinase/acetone carboxylase beta subunit/N-methylhydantoinase B/oxoprolinase/acetone carboxylase alpha subunit
VDIGGTFTDVALEIRGRHVTSKVLTTPLAPEEGVLEGIAKVVAQAGIAPGDVGIIIHGTTLATNAVIERKGAKTALVVTEGQRDSVEMAQENRFEQYDINLDRPTPLVPRHLRWPVAERLDARGAVLRPLDEASVEALVPKIEANGIESLAIGLIHSYANPSHEQRVAEIVRRAFPQLPISLSSEVCPEIREYERLSTTCANAYVRPAMARYLTSLEVKLREAGYRYPFFLMTSGGGLTTLDTAVRFPIRLVESGPAGGAILASNIAAEFGFRHVVSYDMGGTTAKICLIDDATPLASRSFEVARVYRFMKGSGLPIRIPVIEMVEIGAGGGSIVKLDALKRIAVGPESAGAAPGPASYDRGGTEPTVTDADVVLGRIDPDVFAGGSVTLIPEKAGAALLRGVGTALGMDEAHAAFGVSEMVDENMANAARVHAIEWGKDIAARAMIAFGGAAPLHAARLAEKLGIDTVVVPTGAGVGSAIGFLQAPVAYDVVRSRYMRLSGFDAELVNAVLGEMREEAYAIVRQGAGDAPLVETVAAYMRYVGQGHEIDVKLPLRALTAEDGATLKAAFERTYEGLFGRTIPDLDIEVLSWTLTVSTAKPKRRRAKAPEASKGEAVPRLTKRIFDPGKGGFVDAKVYWRDDLQPGMRIGGPALVMEAQTTTVVSASFDGVVDGSGYIVMKRRAEAAAEAVGQAARSEALEQLQRQIMWNRLIAVVEEQAQTLIRTAFSTSVREAGDLSAGVFDLEGRMLAQAVTGTPGHVNAMAASVGFFLERFPAGKMAKGDVYITNNPWKGTGHLHDFTVVTPTFRGGKPVALFAATSHVVDIGGIGFGPDGRQVFDEGLHVPIMALAERGKINQHLIDIVRANVREPLQVEGDLYSLTACNEIGGRRLLAMMDEFGLSSLDALGDYIIRASRQAMLDEIRRLPAGTYKNSMRVDGYDKPIDLVITLRIGEDGIDIDCTGTSRVSNFGINVPLTYTQAYASFGVRCIVGSKVPNNAGSLAPVRVTAPVGTILNAPPPSAVSARHVVGQMLPDVVLGCLAQAVGGAVPAEGTSCLWNPMLMGGHGLVADADYGDATPFSVYLFHTGGTGARPGKDGLSATAFPSGVRNTPVEVNETVAPIIVWKKEYRTDSGGSGYHRGGLGQVMEIAHTEDAPFVISAMFDRGVFPPRGRNGGEDGETGRVRLSSGPELRGKGRQSIPVGTRLVLEMPGGGGLGEAGKREPERVVEDVRNGFVSREAARERYHVHIREDGSLDQEATRAARAALATV